MKDEAEAVHTYNAAIQVCGEALDDGSSELFKSLLLDEEKHADFLEAQLTAIQAWALGTICRSNCTVQSDELHPNLISVEIQSREELFFSVHMQDPAHRCVCGNAFCLVASEM